VRYLYRVSSDHLRLDAQLCFAVHATARAVVQAYEPLLSELGITYPQYLVLLVLWEEDGLSLSRLGERLYLDSGTLTPLTKRLESYGLVERKRATDDERRVEIRLTAEGRALRRKARGIPEKLLCRFDLDAHDAVRLRGELHALLQRFHHPHPTQEIET
jgi:DNA-binding MarR family transcriptional regulator